MRDLDMREWSPVNIKCAREAPCALLSTVAIDQTSKWLTLAQAGYRLKLSECDQLLTAGWVNRDGVVEILFGSSHSHCHGETLQHLISG